MKQFISYLSRKKYETYLASLFILLFGQFMLPGKYLIAWQHILVIQNVLVGLLLFEGVRRWMKYFILILSAILISECLILFWQEENMTIRFSMGVLFSIYFLLASGKIYKEIVVAQKVDNGMIAAVFSGFIMLGFLGTFLFTLIEIAESGSFSHLGEGDLKYQNLSYFSFVSLLTIGYGDIVPITQMAKKTAILLGLLGNFYLTFVAAIIIGKYLQQKGGSET